MFIVSRIETKQSIYFLLLTVHITGVVICLLLHIKQVYKYKDVSFWMAGK